MYIKIIHGENDFVAPTKTFPNIASKTRIFVVAISIFTVTVIVVTIHIVTIETVIITNMVC